MIARFLVEEVIARHGVPRELLSNHGTSFLSRLMLDVYKLMGITKTNTTAYQWDGGAFPQNINRHVGKKR